MVDQEQISEVMRELGKRGGSVKGVKKGFAAMTDEQRREASLKGVKKRARKHAKKVAKK